MTPIGTERYERIADHDACRASRYDRTPTTSINVTLYTPKLQGLRFATTIDDRHKRRETSVKEALIEMSLAEASARVIEDESELP